MIWKRLCFDLQPFKIYTCYKFLGSYSTRKNVKVSILDVAVFRKLVVKGMYFPRSH
jgi:hypothetical protein